MARRDKNAQNAKESQAAKKERMKKDKTDYTKLLQQYREESKKQ